MLSSPRRIIAATASLLVLLSLTWSAATVGAAQDIVYTASNKIAVVDIEKGEALSYIDLQQFVTDIVFTDSGEKAYIGTSKGVTVVDAVKNEVVGHLTDLPVKTLALSSDNNFLYVMDHPMTVQADGTQKGSDYQIQKVDLSTDKVVGQHVLGDNYFDFILSPDNNSIFTLQFQSNEIQVIDTRNWKKIRTITVPTEGTLWKSAASRSHGELYVPQLGEKSDLWILNTAGESDQVHSVKINESLRLRGIAYSTETSRLYLLALGNLISIDTAKGAIVTRKSIEVPYQGIACSRDGSQLYLTSSVYKTGGSVTVVDSKSLEIVNVIDMPTMSCVTIATRP